METRICRICKNEYPLTEEYFYKNVSKGVYRLRTECKMCKYEMKIYNQKLKKAKEEQAKKDTWMEELKDRKFICKLCGQEKTFEEMRKNATQKAITAWCKKCYNNKAKDYKENYKVNVFKKVLEERQERLEKENEENV